MHPTRHPFPNRQLAASADQQAQSERLIAAARADAAKAASERDDVQKKLVWWQQELESAQAEADLYAKAAKAARLEASRAATALKEGFSAAAAAFARGLERSGSLAASESAAPGSGSKRSARRWPTVAPIGGSRDSRYPREAATSPTDRSPPSSQRGERDDGSGAGTPAAPQSPREAPGTVSSRDAAAAGSGGGARRSAQQRPGSGGSRLQPRHGHQSALASADVADGRHDQRGSEAAAHRMPTVPPSPDSGAADHHQQQRQKQSLTGGGGGGDAIACSPVQALTSSADGRPLRRSGDAKQRGSGQQRQGGRSRDGPASGGQQRPPRSQERPSSRPHSARRLAAVEAEAQQPPVEASGDAPLIPRALFQSEDCTELSEEQEQELIAAVEAHGARAAPSAAAPSAAAQPPGPAHPHNQAHHSHHRHIVSHRPTLSGLSDLDDASDVLIGSLSVGGCESDTSTPGVASGFPRSGGRQQGSGGAAAAHAAPPPAQAQAEPAPDAEAAAAAVALLLPGLPLISPRGPAGSCGSAVSTPRYAPAENSLESITGGGDCASGGSGGSGGGGERAEDSGGDREASDDGDDSASAGDSGSTLLMPVMSGQICDQSLSEAAAAAARDRDSAAAGSSGSERGSGGVSSDDEGDTAAGGPRQEAASPPPPRAAPGGGAKSPAAIAASLAAWGPPPSPGRPQEEAGEGHAQGGSWPGDLGQAADDVPRGGQQHRALSASPAAKRRAAAAARAGDGRDSRVRADDRAVDDAAVTRSLPAADGGGGVSFLHTNALFEDDGAAR